LYFCQFYELLLSFSILVIDFSRVLYRLSEFCLFCLSACLCVCLPVLWATLPEINVHSFIHCSLTIAFYLQPLLTDSPVCGRRAGYCARSAL